MKINTLKIQLNIYLKVDCVRYKKQFFNKAYS